MNVILNPDTQRLLEAQMTKGRFATPDDAMQTALRLLDRARLEDYEELDSQTRSAIDEAEAQYQRGEGRPWEEVRAEVLARFVKR
jgi:Arc/MetJ-type ribon-helix-helix transcriptional regulator